ncbi:CRISPR-associated protein Cas6 [Caldalkalibacillus thermarum TA2.A1]|uniref:CRISPR-associated endoribonuclease n=1 Tax=Caldalkalibacillus thermarum (strain TA2.A1) TaxID=986075 RepID=F5L388_CALTT|nr:CRISPR-associated endoribonuclease Cas6 [Caldalkalibacillus thermarum]EGL84190.1 CRISPR-associated protein Cas6 [Caldalkalibacillus thermarum TA2.A1]QZT35185.1 CRISPR-associated endoribonuclease Cas6 [Caldalkalibacillus thermarum TA2.A1]
MRLKVTFYTPDAVSIPVNYHHLISGLLYRSVGDKAFSHFLHDVGYQYEKRKYKLFTFSRLLGNHRYNPDTRTLSFQGDIDLYVSSVSAKFIEEIGQSLIHTSLVQIGEAHLEVKELIYTDRPVLPQDSYMIKMLSPITVYSTFKSTTGQKITHYFHPDNRMFAQQVEDNLLRKYEAFYGQPASERFLIRPVRIRPIDKVVTRFKGTIINAWSGIYEVQSSPELISFAYKAGLGAKTSQGFGMFEFI